MPSRDFQIFNCSTRRVVAVIAKRVGAYAIGSSCLLWGALHNSPGISASHLEGNFVARGRPSSAHIVLFLCMTVPGGRIPDTGSISSYRSDSVQCSQYIAVRTPTRCSPSILPHLVCSTIFPSMHTCPAACRASLARQSRQRGTLLRLGHSLP